MGNLLPALIENILIIKKGLKLGDACLIFNHSTLAIHSSYKEHLSRMLCTNTFYRDFVKYRLNLAVSSKN